MGPSSRRDFERVRKALSPGRSPAEWDYAEVRRRRKKRRRKKGAKTGGGKCQFQVALLLCHRRRRRKGKVEKNAG